MKKFTILFIFCFITGVYDSYCQDDAGTFSITVGYCPNQVLEQKLASGTNHRVNNGKTITADMSGSIMLGFLGLSGGVGIRSYNFSDMHTNDDNPYNFRKTRFDVHVGPIVNIPVIEDYVNICITAQPYLWYSGMTDNGPSVKSGILFTGDLVFGRIFSIGVSYRPFNMTITSTKWNMYQDTNMYYLVEPALEIRAGLYFIWD